VFAQGTAVRRIETRSGSTRKRNGPVRRSRMRPKFASTHEVQPHVPHHSMAEMGRRPVRQCIAGHRVVKRLRSMISDTTAFEHSASTRWRLSVDVRCLHRRATGRRADPGAARLVNAIVMQVMHRR
jgi:hypothetical protein